MFARAKSGSHYPGDTQAPCDKSHRLRRRARRRKNKESSVVCDKKERSRPFGDAFLKRLVHSGAGLSSRNYQSAVCASELAVQAER